jgi:hypothetical protein
MVALTISFAKLPIGPAKGNATSVAIRFWRASDFIDGKEMNMG